MSTTFKNNSQDSNEIIANIDSSCEKSDSEVNNKTGSFYISDDDELNGDSNCQTKEFEVVTIDEQAFYDSICSSSNEQLQNYSKRPTTLPIDRTFDESGIYC